MGDGVTLPPTLTLGGNVVIHEGTVIGGGATLQDGAIVGKPLALGARSVSYTHLTLPTTPYV